MFISPGLKSDSFVNRSTKIGRIQVIFRDIFQEAVGSCPTEDLDESKVAIIGV